MKRLPFFVVLALTACSAAPPPVTTLAPAAPPPAAIDAIAAHPAVAADVPSPAATATAEAPEVCGNVFRCCAEQKSVHALKLVAIQNLFRPSPGVEG